MFTMFYQAAEFSQNLGAWDVTKTTNMGVMFSGNKLGTTNYDAILIGWEAQAVSNNVAFSAGTTKYSAGAAATARTNLVNDHTWTITDGGQV